MKNSLLLFILLCLIGHAKANVYTVHFGTHYGHNYLPNAMIINLGDTVLFSGTFAILPLQSTILPLGADSFAQDTGAALMYIPTALGTHNYKCTSDSLMEGSFYVQSTVSIDSKPIVPYSIKQDFENHIVSIEGLDYQNFTVRIYSASGQCIYQAKNKQILNLSEKCYEKAIYYLQIQINGFIFTDKLFLN